MTFKMGEELQQYMVSGQLGKQFDPSMGSKCFYNAYGMLGSSLKFENKDQKTN